MPFLPALPGRIDQIGIVTPNLEESMDAYIATMGLSFHTFEVDESNGSFHPSSARFRTRFGIAFAGLTMVELIQPVSGRTIHSEYLETHGSGIHHIGMHVARLSSARKGLERRGYATVMEGTVRGLGKYAYFAAPDMRCIVELLQLSLQVPLFLAKRATEYP
jgi:hypothetical protein